ncbi:MULTISPECIES: thiamine phosphate synthase [Methanobrevibacter]|jgi:thiamine-phosphate pyrophosphorylase|uniref:thiamine phosphate synthase n=1 Tax=Methanobrevibacter TaxID=2172 RepID=UPI00033486DE|nr:MULTISPECIES: thiamine phosphate synthase [Methanobrevibacter]AGN16252.1 thiamine monophosphate synthase ThiE [Methanobrevibacter sp. AbM4]MCI6775165.1 thiamine phosphate synthase [Methanobrevibacter boviskoreani]MDD6257610.1 thiamine phosphate synthase [Methanobrevibacter boviskoreani]MDY5614563.1 thiamine phosphate synthase [Methanobrevibacter boviskoreani]
MEDIDYSLYLVTNSTDKRNQEFLNIVEDSLKGGVSVVQVREKELDLIPFYEKAKAVKEITDKFDVPLIINDRLSIAIALGADGAHVGQDDIDGAVARDILGPDRILGISASTVEEAVKAEEDGADYIGCGAVFPTSTKDDADSVDIEEFKKIKKAVSIPVVAIGGIKENNVKELKGSNADGIAVVSAIMDSDNPEKTSENLLNEFKNL